MFILLRTLCFNRKTCRNLLPNHGHEPFWLHPYYMAVPDVPNLLKKPMFSGILSFSLKNMSSGGAAGAKRPRESHSDQPRRQNSYFLRKMTKSQKT